MLNMLRLKIDTYQEFRHRPPPHSLLVMEAEQCLCLWQHLHTWKMPVVAHPNLLFFYFKGTLSDFVRCIESNSAPT